jgi:hypothetical protein
MAKQFGRGSGWCAGVRPAQLPGRRRGTAAQMPLAEGDGELEGEKAAVRRVGLYHRIAELDDRRHRSVAYDCTRSSRNLG